MIGRRRRAPVRPPKQRPLRDRRPLDGDDDTDDERDEAMTGPGEDKPPANGL